MICAPLCIAIACVMYKPTVQSISFTTVPTSIAASDNRGTVVNRGGKGRGNKGVDGKSKGSRTTSNLDERVRVS